MGQVCISAEDQRRIVELEASLRDQTEETIDLRGELMEERDRYETQQKEMKDISSEKIEQLGNEKKQLFKTMLKEKKNVSKLEDQIEDYKKQITDIKDKMETLKYEKEKQEQERKEQERKEKKRKEMEALTQLNMERSKSDPVPTKKKAFQMAGLGHIGAALDSIKMPNLQAINAELQSAISVPIKSLKGLPGELIKLPGELINMGSNDNTTIEPAPFKVKPKESKDDDEDHNDDDFIDPVEHKSTIILDEAFDARSEATHVYSWLHDMKGKNKQQVKQLKVRLASVLTARSEGYRQVMMQEYREEYGIRLDKDIVKIITKGNALHIIQGLLMTRAQYDAILISECVANWDIQPVADIICCRNLRQIVELHSAYKKKCKLNVTKQLQALAQKDKKRTLVKVIGRIFDKKRKEKKEVDMNCVNIDLNFILTTKTFKNENKEKLVLVFTANSVQYVKVLNDQFLLKSKDSLTTFIDKKLGPKSTVGYFCKTRIEYALNPSEFYARKIQKLGMQFKKNQKKISDIFIQRMEDDLDLIQRFWKMKKYGDGKELKQWIISKCGGTSSAEFYSKMLDNCARYVDFHKKKEPKKKMGTKFAKLMM